MFRINNPIPDSIRDTEQIKKQFEKFKIVPYYGTTSTSSHSFLDLLESLCTLSGAFNSAVNDLCKYSFGRNISITAQGIPGLDVEVDEINPDQQLEFYQFLSGLGLKATDILSLSKQYLKSMFASGNVWLKVRRVEVGDVVRYKFRILPFKNVAYLKQESFELPVAIYTAVWGDDSYWQKNPPEQFVVTNPEEELNWNNRGNGIFDALIHWKAPGSDSVYYGRPVILGILNWLYVDYTLSDLCAKIGGTEIVSKKLIALEERGGNALNDDNLSVEDRAEIGEDGHIATEKADDFRRAALTLKKLVTNQGGHGDASSIAVVEYPKGNQEPKAIDLELNRDTQHQQFLQDTAIRQICSAIGWASELTGLQGFKSGIGGNIAKDLFIIKNASTVGPVQDELQSAWNWLIDEIVKQEQATAFDGLGISYNSIISKIVDDLQGVDGAAQAETLLEAGQEAIENE